MIGDTQNQTDKELFAWIDSIPISKPARNLTRDFSDAVLMAEILKVYYPRYVELHNYVPASNLNMKKENWNTLNRKVLAKIDMKLSKDTIHHLANASQGAIEKLLLELKMKILKNDEETHRPKSKYNAEGTRYQIITKEIKNGNDETVCRAIYMELKQELREKEEIICTLNHKITYLESSMKVKDLRISSLTTQILQNGLEIDQSTISSGDARVKLRSRSHNFHETKTN
ncbi:hypothetical protein ACFW04_001220 [Cataglyphis niger]